MPSTRTKTPSSKQTTIMVDADEFDAAGLEERSMGAVSGDPLPLPAARAGALSPQLIDQALDHAWLRRAVSELPEQQRTELVGELLE